MNPPAPVRHRLSCFNQIIPLLCLILLIGAAPRASAQTIPNPSFETNTFSTGDGFVSDNTTITGWTATPPTAVGLNPAGNGNVFADNGAVPNGTKVAFLKSTGGVTATLSTNITGLTVGTTYRVQFRFNRRVSGGTVAPQPSYRINGGSVFPFYVSLGVGGSNPYYTFNALFTATATTAAFEVSNTTTGESCLLVDNFLVTTATAIQVTNANDSGAGSLRAALTTAQGTPAANVITFAPALNGATIPLTSQITLSDPNGVCLDASSLSNGIKIDPMNNARALFNSVGSVCSMRKVTLENANIAMHAGAILNEGFMQLHQCKFFGNVAGGVGAAVYNNNVISLTECLFVGNTSSIAGAGLLHEGASATVTQCTFMNNHSTSLGGAIYATSPGFSITACTFTGNSVDGGAGGAIYLDNGAVLALTHCTISGNTGGYGGGISNHGTVTVKNCIIAGNTANVNGATADVENNGFSPGKGVSTLEGANIIPLLANTSGGSSPGTPRLTDSPELTPILERGGFAPTMGLEPDSPARDAAVDSTATMDQRGKPVIGVADIGAYEMQAGVFSLSATAYKTLEGNQVSVMIDRGGEVAGNVTVRLTTTAGTATSPADFEARPNTTASDIVFSDGDESEDPAIVTVPDVLVEGNHTFTVTLSIPTLTLGAALSTPVTATVTIVDPLQVTNTNDDGPGSLRAAMAAAAANSGADAVHFAAGLNGQTITLGSEIEIEDPDQVTVDASNLASGVTVDGGPGDDRIFDIAAGSNVVLRRLKLTGGNGGSDDGGAVFNEGTLSVFQCTFSGNTATGSGGAIYSTGTAQTSLTKCTLNDNIATASGGSLCADQDAALILELCTISGNSAPSGPGGGIFTSGSATAQVTHCTIKDNQSGTSGGGILVDGASHLTLAHSIVHGNTVISPSDLRVMPSGFVTLVGKTFAQAIVIDGTADGSGTLDNANPNLLPLASNGGFTRTHALDSDSPARDAADALLGYTDQRGLSSVGVTDTGAYELQPGGVFSLSEASYSAMEGSPISVTVKRSSGTGAANVRVITTAGSATSPADFAARPNTAASQVNFVDGQAEATIAMPGIATVSTVGAEANEVFTISLVSPSAGTTLGTPSSASAVIRDSTESTPFADSSFPSGAFTSPAANAVVDVPVGGVITVTGSATDNKGVLAVFMDANGTDPGPLTLSAPRAAATTWSRSIIPIAGTNTVSIAVLDTQNNAVVSAATRTFKVRRPLAVNISGKGTVTSGFAPSSYREVGLQQTVTASPGTGWMFAGWTILSSHTPAEIGVAAGSLEKQTLTFLHRESLALRANFVPNPYAALAGEFNGLIHAHPTLPDRPGPEDGTLPDNSSEGLLSATVMGTGAFSAKLTIDGTTLIAIGAFDHQGVARFGTARATTFAVARTGKPSLFVAFTIDIDPGRPKDTISGTVTARSFQQSSIAAESTVLAERAFYDGLTPDTTVHHVYLGAGNATQAYTAILPPRDNTALGLDLRDYPQGTGYALVTVNKAGVVSITSARLADGTTFTASCKLSKENIYPLFVPLYSSKGWLSGDVQLDYALSDSDMSTTLRWLRPLDTTKQHYPNGWTQVIDVGFMGARYAATFSPAGSVLLQEDDGDPDHIGQPLSPPDPILGNAALTFTQGQLTEDILHLINVSTTNAVTKVVTNDPTYSLTITGATGMFSGKFVHELDAGVVTPLQTDFQGVMYQKCLVAGGHGFFLNRQPVPIDYTGQSGSVQLIGH